MFIDKVEKITDCIVLDTETVTDVISKVSKVWEIGVVVIQDDQIVETKEWLINPGANFDKLDLFYPENHVSVDRIKSSPLFIDLQEDLKQYFCQDNIILGHNIDYDIRMINKELIKCNLPLIGSYKVDTIRIAKLLYAEWKQYNLDALCKHYDIIIPRRHRALDDAYATAQIYLLMKDALLKQQNTINPEFLF